MTRNQATWLALLLSFGATLAAFFLFPERIPVHWNAAGEVDRWGAKYELWIIPAIQLAMVGFMAIWPRLDPLRRGEWKSWPLIVAVTAWVLTLTQLAVLYLTAVTLDAGGLRSPEAGLKALLFAIGVVFIVLGNYLPKAPPNWVFGIRTPWTLTSPRVWQRVHRVGGWLFVVLGALTLVLAVLLPPVWALYALLVLLGLATLYLVVLSYLLWRAEGAQA